MKVRAAVLTEVGGPVEIREIDLDPPREGEVLVKVMASGLCGSDLHVIDGKLGQRMPVVLGHEAAGVVVEIGENVSTLAPGDHVVLSIVPACGSCDSCRSNRPNLCELSGKMAESGTLADGTTRFHSNGSDIYHFNSVSSFAEYTVVPQAGAIRVPKLLGFEVAALMSCALMTGVGAVLNTARVGAGASIAVLGCGGVGLSVIQGAVLADAHRIIAIDGRQEALDRARQIGATDVILADGRDVVGAVQGLISGGVEFAFEAVGSPDTISQAWDMLRAGGRAVAVGLPPQDARVELATWGLIYEKQLLGCFLGSAHPSNDVARLLDFVAQGRLSVESMVGQRVALEDLPRAIDQMRAGEGARWLLTFE